MTRQEAERELSRERPILWGYTEDKVLILHRELLITERLARREAEERVKELEEIVEKEEILVRYKRGRRDGIEEAAKVCFWVGQEVAMTTDHGYVAHRTADKIESAIRTLIGDTP